MFDTPKNAEKPAHVVLVPSLSEQDYFFVTAAFPSTEALDHYNKVFASWTSCRAQEAGWLSFGDLSSGSPRFIHNLTRYWVSNNNKFAIAAFIRYTSKDTESRAQPDNSQQLVVVLRNKVEDARAFLSELSVTCPASSNPLVDRDAPRATRPSP